MAHRVWIFLSLVALGACGVATSASAAEPVHIKQTIGPISVDLPAGALCDFAYHEEDGGTQNVKRFFDDDGNLVAVEDQLHATLLHRNIDSGLTLTEELHYAVHIDFVTGAIRTTGQTWRLRDEAGNIVLSGTGLLAVDLFTGEVTKETPKVLGDAAATLCPALGGAPAP
jgi:hypothetical protein